MGTPSPSSARRSLKSETKPSRGEGEPSREVANSEQSREDNQKPITNNQEPTTASEASTPRSPQGEAGQEPPTNNKQQTTEIDAPVVDFENLDSPEDLEEILESTPPAEASSETPKVRELSREDLDQLQSKLGPDLLKKLKDDYRGEWLHVRSR